MQRPVESLSDLLAQIRACRACEPLLSHGARPVLRASMAASLLIVGQAPGIRVHNSGLPFNDPSGDRLRDWMNVDRETFYDERRIAIVPMGFCFPGYDAHGGDLAPRKECAALWRKRLFAVLPDFRLTLLVGSYAQSWHLGDAAKQSVTETVAAWRSYGSACLPLPHPSWRNNGWIKKHPWFQDELLPDLRRRVQAALRP